MDEEIKKDNAGDDRVFVDAMTDDTAPASGADNAPKADVQADNGPKPLGPVPSADQDKPAGNPMPPINQGQPMNNNMSNPMPPINQGQPMNNNMSNPMPPINQGQPVNNNMNNPMPPINQGQPANNNMNNQMPPINQGQPMNNNMNNQMPPVNQGPMNNNMNNQMPPMGGQPMNGAPMGAPMQQPAPNPLFSAPPQEPPKKKKGGGIIIVLLIVLILLAAATVGVLFATGVLGPKKEIQLSKTSVKIESGEELVIMVENYEDDLNGVYLNYESEDPKIIKITEEYDDAFVIEGKKKGKTTITVSGKGCEPVTINVTVKD